MKTIIGINSEKRIEYSDSQIDKPQRGRPKRAGLPDIHCKYKCRSY